MKRPPASRWIIFLLLVMIWKYAITNTISFRGILSASQKNVSLINDSYATM